MTSRWWALVLLLTLGIQALAGTGPGRAAQAVTIDPCPRPIVNTRNANVNLSKVELRLDWSGPTFEIRRTYNSRLRLFRALAQGTSRSRGKSGRGAPQSAASAVPNVIGIGWRLAFTQQVMVAEGSPETIVILEDDGAVFEYKKDPASSRFVLALGGSHHYVERRGTGFGRRRAGLDESFDAQGRLTKVSDLVGRSLEIDRSAKGAQRIVDSSGRTVTLSLDGAGRVTRIADPAGRTLKYAYDPLGRLVRATDPLGQVTEYGYDDGHRLVRIGYPGGQEARLGYTADRGWCQWMQLPGRERLEYAFAPDPASPGATTCTLKATPSGTTHAVRYSGDGMERTTVGPDGSTTVERICPICGGYQVSRDAEGGLWAHEVSLGGLRHEAVDPDGGRTVTEYSPVTGAIAKRTDPDGRWEAMLQDAQGCDTDHIDLDGVRTKYMRDELSELVRMVEPSGATWSLVNNKLGLAVALTDPTSGTVNYARDVLGRVTGVRDADGHRTGLNYDALDRVVSVVESGSSPTTFAYDEWGRLARTTDPTGASVTLRWHPAGLPSSLARSDGGRIVWTHDGDGRIIEAREEDGPSYKVEYDVAGRMAAQVDILGRRTAFQRDRLGRLVTMTDPSGGVTRYRWTASGRLSAVVDAAGREWKRGTTAAGLPSRFVDPDGGQVSLKLDGRGRLVERVDPLGRKETRRYDESGHVISVEDAVGNVSRWIYDASSRVKAHQDPVLGRIEYSWSPGGRLTRSKRVGGVDIRLAYNRRTRQTATSLGNTGTTTTTFDVMGRRVEQVSGDAKRRWEFTSGGDLSATTDLRRNRTDRYAYGPFGRRRSWIDPDGRRTTYAHDVAGRLARIDDRLGFSIRYEYDSSDLVVRREIVGGPESLYRRDPTGQLLSVEHRFAGKTIVRHEVTRTPLGLVGSLQESGGTTRLDLDGAGRIKRLVDGTGKTTEFTFDGLDHVREIKQGERRDSRQLGPAGQLLSNGVGAFTTGPSGVVATEPTTASKIQYRYDDQGRLVGASGARDEITLDYVEDFRWAGVRSPKGVVRFEHELDRIVTERNGAAQVLVQYVHGQGIDEPIIQVVGGQAQYLLGDVLGSIRTILDAKGAVIATRTYGPFGAETARTGTATSRFGYIGRPEESTLGLVDMRLRWYAPRLAAFLTPDPINLLMRYAYGFGHPLCFTDPLGLGWGSWVATGLVGAASVFAVVVLAPAAAAALGGGIIAGAVGAGITGGAIGATWASGVAAATGGTVAQTVRAGIFAGLASGTSAAAGGLAAAAGAGLATIATVNAVANGAAQGWAAYQNARFNGQPADPVSVGRSIIGGALGGAIGTLLPAAILGRAQVMAPAGADFTSSAVLLGTGGSVGGEAVQTLVDTAIPALQNDIAPPSGSRTGAASCPGH